MKTVAVDLIVFDLDGTLADSLPDLTIAANFASRRLGLPEHSPEQIKNMIGGGELKFVERFLGPENGQYVEEALGLYLEHYARHCGDLTRLYPGVRETLAHFSGRQRLAVLSNKRQSLTEKVLEVMGIRDFFEAVQGGGSEHALKPSAEPLTALIEALGAAPGRTLMVGDKPADVLSGRGAGAVTAAVTYGYGELAAILAVGPDFVLPELTGLREVVA